MSNQQVNDLADESSDLERLWAEHLNGEFLIKDVETTLETMVTTRMSTNPRQHRRARQGPAPEVLS